MFGDMMCSCLHLEQYFGVVKDTHPVEELGEAPTVQVMDLDELIDDTLVDEDTCVINEPIEEEDTPQTQTPHPQRDIHEFYPVEPTHTPIGIRGIGEEREFY